MVKFRVLPSPFLRVMGTSAPLAGAFLALALFAAPASGQCGTTLFAKDFESGAHGWTVTGDWLIGPVLDCGEPCVQGRAGRLLGILIGMRVRYPILTDIPQINFNFVEIVQLSHRQGNCIPFAAIR